MNRPKNFRLLATSRYSPAAIQDIGGINGIQPINVQKPLRIRSTFPTALAPLYLVVWVPTNSISQTDLANCAGFRPNVSVSSLLGTLVQPFGTTFFNFPAVR